LFSPLTAEGCDLEAPWRGSARIIDGWEGLVPLQGWDAGSQLDAPHLALDVERVVHSLLQGDELASSWMVILLTNEFAGVVAPSRGSATDGELVGEARGEASPPPVRLS